MAKGRTQHVPIFSEASGVTVLREGKVTIDASNASFGYIMVKHDGSGKRLKLRNYFGDTYQTYDLNSQGRYEAFPLINGDGTYKVVVLENVKDADYAQVASQDVSVRMDSEYAPFLVPNQYVRYTARTQAVELSKELCAGVEDDWAKVELLYEYVSGNIIYDYMKALTVRNPYYPSVDETLAAGTGICLDYTALLACMLRVQGIPTMLVVGDLLPTGQRHAWNKVFVGGDWVQMDPTFPSDIYKQSDYVDLYFY